ncbi:MAG: Flagellar assembly protein FliH/Type secretion system HrpE [Planctomycetaceae bacterium]|nr:Flagellar assembly protein FliH/Type secretion system HrpE [Planctomycetaceae bacterium]
MPVIETGRVLKADSLSQRGLPISFQYTDIEQRCDAQLQAAQAQAEQILAAAEAHAAELRDEAWQLGHTTGSLQAEAEFEAQVEAEVQQRLQERLRHLVPALQTATSQLIQDREQILLQWESAAIQLSLTLAERIVRRELQIQPVAPRALIAEVLQLAAGASSIVLRLHPTDVQEIKAHSAEWQELLSKPVGLKVIADPQITRGGCLVETPQGEIDGRIETQLARLASELMGNELS